jgi:hypothetical protein
VERMLESLGTKNFLSSRGGQEQHSAESSLGRSITLANLAVNMRRRRLEELTEFRARGSQVTFDVVVLNVDRQLLREEDKALTTRGCRRRSTSCGTSRDTGLI